MHLTARLLGHLSQEISRGNALWALLISNEYLPAHSPLRLALTTKARPHILKDETDTLLHNAAGEILAGRTLRELSPALRQRVAQNTTMPGKKEFCAIPSAWKLRLAHANRLGRRTSRCFEHRQSSIRPRIFLKSKIRSYALVSSMNSVDVSTPEPCVKSG